MELTTRIKNANLSQKERLVVQHITKEIDKTAFLSGVQLAEECGVSAPFITRLVRKLGYERFTEFKDQLEELYKKTTSPYDMFQSFLTDGEMTEVIQTSVIQDMANLSNMEKLLNPSVLESVVDVVDKCGTVYMAAMFASEIAVRALGHYLWRLGKPSVELLGVGLSKKMEFSEIGENDVFIAFSSQRVLREVVEAVSFAKKQGAATVAVTDNSANPLACACDYVLVAPVKGVAVDYTHVATLAMVNLIANCLAKKSPEAVAASLEQEVEKCSSRNLFCL